MKNNSQFIEDELLWLQEIITTRLKLYFNQECGYASIHEITAPPYDNYTGAYPEFIGKYSLSLPDRICLVLSLASLLRPQLFDSFQIKNAHTEQRFSEFGCVPGVNFQGVLPTLETWLFILSGDDVRAKIQLIDDFFTGIPFVKKMVLVERLSERDPLTASVLVPSDLLLETLVYGKRHVAEFSLNIPARRLTTMQQWEDLMLDEYTMAQINEIKLWIEYGEKVLEEWELRNRIKPGYRALFYGPSGTGKTFTASLLGKYTGKEVFCIDLSLMVSKYIGETEKNLARLFDVAESRDWILFFDEADALFGKRTNIKDAHDRYANQEVSYLLQRIEAYDGLVVLATNLKSNIDDAFARRFQSVVRFPVPDAGMRLRLWKNTFSRKTTFEETVNLNDMAREYEVTGGTILNVVQYASLKAMSRNSNIILKSDIVAGIRKEYHKEGKTLN